MSDTYEQALKLIKERMCEVYKEWYPLEKIVKETRSLDYTVFTQTGIIVYESRDITHFIVPTTKLYDLIKPMEYEYRVCIYDTQQASLLALNYGREIDCRGYVTIAQAKLYGFDCQAYMQGKGKLVLIEKQLMDWSDKLSDQEWQDLQQLSLFLQSAIRKELGLEENKDLGTHNKAVIGVH